MRKRAAEKQEGERKKRKAENGEMERGGEMATGGLSSRVGEEHRLSDLRIVLLGANESGKSLAGNTILGREEFPPGKRTAQCEKRQGVVAGRKVTLVDTPGWWGDSSIDDSPELLKHQIVSSVSLCSPGPHALLLLIDVESFQEKHRRAVEQHMELLSETVWRHTIVLFTFGDSLGETTIEQHIKREQALQWAIEKCGNRYHVLSSKNRSEVSQVTELLEKIEGMVAGNGGCQFHMKSEVLQEMEGKRRITEERVNQRVKEVQKQRETLQALKGNTDHLSEVRVVLLGWMGAGKRASGNTILGRRECGAWKRSPQCEKRRGEVAGRQVTVVNTPGWWKYIPAELTPDWLKQEVVKSLTLCPLGPHAILLIIPAET
ncbi:hypothetical protein AAFF_G00353800 [Aldrovandia affinis]|uniref:AIG1-type G domain-containing protein n=1 Tax=Aldrovandia affinis TaxID=143900 RepID=A0AAD7R5I5_9TELE|nr:hypothetical protein AAFF_G00353800 [Aldrovandia affinis]